MVIKITDKGQRNIVVKNILVMNVKIRTLYWESRKAIQLQPPKTPTCKNANLSFEIE